MHVLRLSFASVLASIVAGSGVGWYLQAEALYAQTQPSEEPPAGTFFGYSPPDRGAPRRTRGAGSRGCQATRPLGLTLLVPSDHTGRTISSHPTFAWHLAGATDVPVEFTLVQPGVAQPLYAVTLPQQPEGYGQIALPAEVPALEIGQEYRWSVEAICNPKRPSSNIFAQGWIERIELSPELAQTLERTSNRRDEALVYAEAGVWFEALSTLSEVVKLDASARADRLALMKDGGIELLVDAP
ncbi:MAG: DUF928 domain-containing protein [Cyanobacteria bacterium P01_D01_bin.123]